MEISFEETGNDLTWNVGRQNEQTFLTFAVFKEFRLIQILGMYKEWPMSVYSICIKKSGGNRQAVVCATGDDRIRDLFAGKSKGWSDDVYLLKPVQ